MGNFVGIISARKIGHKISSALTMILYASCFYISSEGNFVVFFIFIGVMTGFCIGTEYLIPVDNAYFYYPHRKVPIFLIIGSSRRANLMRYWFWSCCIQSSSIILDKS